MRKPFLYTALILTVCSLLTVALISYSRTVNTDICSATSEQAEKINHLDGKLLWESLSSQFVSSVNY